MKDDNEIRLHTAQDGISEEITDEQILGSIASAIEADTPDILNDLMLELGLDADAGTPESSGEYAGSSPEGGFRRTRSAWVRAALSCAAVFAIIAFGLGVFRDNSAFAVVGLDVNPSIELSIDRNGRVISAGAVNEDGEDILEGLDLKGTDVNVACSAIVGVLLKEGYLTSTSNSLLVSVRSEDSGRGHEIETALAEELNSYLENTEIAASILGMYVEYDDELESFASRNGISVGKAWLIRKLLETGSARMTEESLMKLSTQELILLAQNRNVSSEQSIGRSDTSGYIGQPRAEEIALEHAGCSRTDAAYIHSEFDCEDGVIIYEVEFLRDGQEYEYDIEASTGNVIRYEKEHADSDGESDDDYDDDDDDDHDDDDHDDFDDDDDDHDDDHDDHDDDHDRHEKDDDD